MFEIVLYEPEIPPNTGNIIRLCANTGARLNLIAPLGFTLDDARLRRAGLDYHEYASVRVHENLAAARAQLPGRWWAYSTRARRRYDTAAPAPGEVLLFGPESRGLPAAVLAEIPDQQQLQLPQFPGRRSLNLSNAVAVAVYEAWRHAGFEGSEVK